MNAHEYFKINKPINVQFLKDFFSCKNLLNLTFCKMYEKIYCTKTLNNVLQLRSAKFYKVSDLTKIHVALKKIRGS